MSKPITPHGLSESFPDAARSLPIWVKVGVTPFASQFSLHPCRNPNWLVSEPGTQAVTGTPFTIVTCGSNVKAMLPARSASVPWYPADYSTGQACDTTADKQEVTVSVVKDDGSRLEIASLNGTSSPFAMNMELSDLT